jgi:hypothetical protein
MVPFLIAADVNCSYSYRLFWVLLILNMCEFLYGNLCSLRPHLINLPIIRTQQRVSNCSTLQLLMLKYILMPFASIISVSCNI